MPLQNRPFRWLYALPLRIRSLVRGEQVERELHEEIQYHIDRVTDANIAEGMSPRDARAAALRALGGVAQRMEESRDTRRVTLLTDLGRDLRYAARMLRRAPAFTAVAVVSLALGTGANTAVFQMIEALRLRPLPVSHASDLAIVRIPDPQGASGQFSGRYPDLTYVQWERLRGEQQAFDGMLAWSHATLDLSASGESRFSEDSLWVSGGFFDVLGVRPQLGRLFTEADDVKGCAAPGVVVSHGFWSREFGRDPAAVGRTLSINGRRFPVLGVTAAGFHGVEVGRSFDLALPLCAEQLLNGEDSRMARDWSWWLGVMGRLKPGWTVERASAHLQALSPALYRDTLPSGSSPDTAKSYLEFRLAAESGASGFSTLRAQYDLPLKLLLTIAGIVLLIACANLANLLLARISTRHREVAVRLALGASRGRVFRQLLVESLLLAAIGTACGAALAPLMCRTAVAIMSSQVDPVFVDVALDWRALSFVVGLAAATCMLFGTAPALGATRVTLDEAMKAGGRANTAPRGRLAARRVLVVAQLALSLILLVSGLLFTRSLFNLLTTDAGFRQAGVLEIDVDLRRLKLDAPGRIAIRKAILDRIRATPGVEAAASAMAIPLVNNWSQTVHLEDPAPVKKGLSYFSGATRGYFGTLEIPMVRGRDFDGRDRPGSPRVAVVNERFVERFIGGADPIGRTFLLESSRGVADRRVEIIGVVKNTKYASLREPFRAIVYLGAEQNDAPGDFDQILMRSTQPIPALSASVKRAVEAMDPRIAFHFHDFQEQIRYSIRQDRLMALLCGFFALLAAVLATIGVYGVMSYTASQRTGEIGIRLALGAERGAIVRMMLRDAGILLAIGLAIGAALTPLVTKAAGTLLFGLQPTDTLTFTIAVLTLGTAIAASSYLPARRAARVDPLVALRHD
jgi:putative ABC transport system permease protein